MLTRSQRRQRQISNEQEGRDVTDEAPSVDGEGTEEPTAMSDGGDANASGSRSSHLSPLTGSETSEEAARWLANFQQLYQPKLHNANYQTVLTFLVANTAQGTPAWTLLQDTQHDADWLKKALAASKDAETGSERQAVAKAAAELFTKWDDAVRKEFVTKRNKLESSQLHTIKVSGKKDRPEHMAKLMEQEVERVAPEYNMEQLQRVVVDAYTKHSELHQYLREWVKSSEGMEAVSTHDEAHSDMSDVTLQPEEVTDLLTENARRVKAEGEHPELFAMATRTRRLTTRQGIAIGLIRAISKQAQIKWNRLNRSEAAVGGARREEVNITPYQLVKQLQSLVKPKFGDTAWENATCELHPEGKHTNGNCSVHKQVHAMSQTTRRNRVAAVAEIDTAAVAAPVGGGRWNPNAATGRVGGGAQPTGQVPRPGDWECGVIGCRAKGNRANFASKTQCYMCNTPKDKATSGGLMLDTEGKVVPVGSKPGIAATASAEEGRKQRIDAAVAAALAERDEEAAVAAAVAAALADADLQGHQGGTQGRKTASVCVSGGHDEPMISTAAAADSRVNAQPLPESFLTRGEKPAQSQPIVKELAAVRAHGVRAVVSLQLHSEVVGVDEASVGALATKELPTETPEAPETNAKVMAAAELVRQIVKGEIKVPPHRLPEGTVEFRLRKASVRARRPLSDTGCNVWVITTSLWKKLEGALPRGVSTLSHDLTTAMGEGKGEEVPLEAGMTCAVAPGTENETWMPCSVVVAEDNAVFDCLIPTLFHYAYNAYVVPAKGVMYWNPDGLGTTRVATLPVRISSHATCTAVDEPEHNSQDGSGNEELARLLVDALRA